jgi:hypothetical protein
MTGIWLDAFGVRLRFGFGRSWLNSEDFGASRGNLAERLRSLFMGGTHTR